MEKDTINIKEREKMIKVLEGIEAGKSRSEAAKLAGCHMRKVLKWINDGKFKKSANTIYFVSELKRMDNEKSENKSPKTNFKPVNENIDNLQISKNFSSSKSPSKKETEIKPDIFDVKNISDKEIEAVITKFNNYFKNPFYKMDIREFNVSFDEMNIIKNNILKDIKQKRIVGDVDCKRVLKQYCANFCESKEKLNDNDFEVIFNEVDTSSYDKLLVEECKLKTINDYNSNKINRDLIKTRFVFHIKRKIKAENQLQMLEKIKDSPYPLIKIHLTPGEQEDIYNLTEEKIFSNFGLKGTVLEFVTFNMNRKLERNKSDARKQFISLRYNRRHFMDMTNLDDEQLEDFIKEIERLIDEYKIKTNDINEDFIKQCSYNFLNSDSIL